MCLNIKSGPHIAEKDIHVSKILLAELRGTELSFCTPYRGMRVKPGVLYKAPLLRQWTLVTSGLHAFQNDFVKSYKSDSHTLVSQAKRSANNREKLIELLELLKHINRGVYILVRATIPAGSTYYIGRHGDIVANQLILD